MSTVFSPIPHLPTTPESSSSRACRTFPLSPLNPFRYAEYRQKKDDDLKHAIEIEMNRNPMSSPPLPSSRGDGGGFFPPPLGSSSPPIPSPTPGASGSHWNGPPSSPCSVSTSTSTLRPGNSQGLSFASRARARQPLPLTARTAAPDPHARWGTRPSLGRHSQSASASGYTSFGESVDGMTERSVKGAMWRGKFRQQCLDVYDRGRDGDERGLMGDDKAGGSASLRSKRRSWVGGGSKPKKRGDVRKAFDPAGDDDEDMSNDTDEEGDHEEIFRRMMQKQRRQLMHQAQVQYDREVGGSDPAVLEMDIRQAEAEAEEASTSNRTPDHSPLPGQTTVPGTIWRYRPSPPRNGIPMSTPLTEPTTDVFFMGDTSFEHDPGHADQVDLDSRQVELDEEELSRLAQMEEEERLMIDRFGNGFRGSTQATDVFLDGLTWEDLAPDEEELGMGEDVEMSCD